MQLGTISFCDRICFNIKSLDTKDEILNYIENRYNIRILEKHWHHLDDKNVEYIIKIPHLACIRSNGNPYYMVMTLYEDTPIIYYIDKKIHPGYQKPRIILGRGKFNSELFNDTIIDGEMVKDGKLNWIFLINDILVYKGTHLINKSLPDRLELAFELFNKFYKKDAPFDVCKFQIKKYAMSTQEGTEALIKLSKELSYTSRGIYYWPFMFKYKPKLFHFDETVIKTVYRKVKDTLDFQLNAPSISQNVDVNPAEIPVQVPIQIPIQVPIQVPTSSSSDNKIYWLRKTDYPDVYDVYDSIQGNKLSVAYVPTLAVSKMLRNIFKTATVAMFIPFECEFNENIKKWLPLKLHTP